MKETAAIVGCVLLVLLAVFQTCLAAGAPWGRLAWGGRSAILSTGLRMASFAAVFVYVFLAAILLDRAGLTRLLPWPMVVERGIWVVVGLFGLGLVLNLISSSRAERRLMSPVAALLTAAGIVVALG